METSKGNGGCLLLSLEFPHCPHYFSNSYRVSPLLHFAMVVDVGVLGLDVVGLGLAGQGRPNDGMVERLEWLDSHGRLFPDESDQNS